MAWLGVCAGDAGPWWSRVEDEMTQAAFGRRTWVLTEDLDALRSAPTLQEVRLLRPHDTYTRLLDRETIVDKRYHPNV